MKPTAETQKPGEAPMCAQHEWRLAELETCTKEFYAEVRKTLKGLLEGQASMDAKLKMLMEGYRRYPNGGRGRQLMKLSEKEFFLTLHAKEAMSSPIGVLVTVVTVVYFMNVLGLI